jgi:zinc protease
MTMRYLKLIPFLLLLATPAVALANPFEQLLANGLRVIVKEDHRAPTVAHMVWYRAGSMDETNGTTGVAHLLEHMMFKGTPTTGAGEFSRLVAAAGGRDNAFTSKDYTAYFQQVPKQKLAQMMRLEADRMRHLTLDAKEFAQEIKVVMEERRLRTEDQPQALLGEQMGAVAFQAHPYRVPVIGWMNDLESMTVQDARNWYERWYVPMPLIFCRSEMLHFQNSVRLFPQDESMYLAMSRELSPEMPVPMMILKSSASDKLLVPFIRSFFPGMSSSAQKRMGILFS